MGPENRAVAPAPLWILNPDAELELESPHYQTNHGILAAMRENLSRFALLIQGDEFCLLSDLKPAPERGRQALLWCPTPRAVQTARKLGYSLPKAPPVGVLAAANNKSTLITASLPAPLCREFLWDASALARIQSLLDAHGPLRLKRLFGFAGRRQRKIQAPLRPDDRRFIGDGIRLGGLLVENELEILGEYSIHGTIPMGERENDGTGRPRLGHPCHLTTDRFGSVTSIERLSPDHLRRRELEELGNRAVAHLTKLGYAGPFGLDVLETTAGLVASDLNARFTLGFSVGLGSERNQAIMDLYE